MTTSKAKSLAVQNSDGSFTSVVSLPEVAEALGISYGNAKVRASRGQLPEPVFVVGNSSVWARDEIEELAEREAQKRARAGREPAAAGA